MKRTTLKEWQEEARARFGGGFPEMEIPVPGLRP